MAKGSVVYCTYNARNGLKIHIAAAKKAAKEMVEEAVMSTGNASEVLATVAEAPSRKRKNTTTSPDVNPPVAQKQGDEDRGEHLNMEEDSETLSNIDKHEGQSGLVGQAPPTTGSAFDHIDLSHITPFVAPTLLAFAEGCCKEYRLSALVKEDVMRTTSDKSNIASTGEKLAIQGYQISEDHLKQFALLRQLSEDYIKAEAEAQAKKVMENAQARNCGRGKKKKVDGGPQKALTFWTYIDGQMNRFHKYPPAKCSKILKEILHKDRKKYPNHTGQACWFPPSNQLIVSYTLTAVQEGQEAPLIDSGAQDENKGPANRADPPEEEDGNFGGDEDDRNTEDGTSTNADFQDLEDPPTLSDDEMAHTLTHQCSEERCTSDNAKTAPALPRIMNNSLPNNSAQTIQVTAPHRIQHSEGPPIQWGRFEGPVDHKVAVLQTSHKPREVARSP
ncbi:hypothetical protein FRC11_010101 [Ceratobasidium sp. 423]|nr:hypothetical protein FRC11_010101 [Ceratobasidium sp. 423]